eukprot:jgi/Botrbrau1/14690/Bobra.0108s0046.1
MARQDAELRPSKRHKVEVSEMTNVIVQFQSDTGASTGPQFDVPHVVTPAQLETLLRKFLGVEEAVPYSFFVEDKQVCWPTWRAFTAAQSLS